MKKTYLWIAILTVLAMALSACNVPQAPAATTAANQGQATPNTQNTPLPQATATSGASSLPQVLNLQSGLDAADSYRTTFKMELVGKNEADEDVDEIFQMNQEIIRSKNANKVTWMSNTSTDMPEFTIIYLDGKAYMDTSAGGQSGCFMFSAEDAQSELGNMTPSNFVGDISPENLVASGENVNGMLTNHYSVKQSALVFWGEVTSSSGDIWVSADGKYVVKYVYQAEGVFDMMSQGSKVTGKMTIGFDMSDINNVAEITIPEACQAQLEQMADLPMTADASDVSNMSGMVSYSTASDLAAVKDFYMTTGASQGWVFSDDSSMEGFVSFKITKGSVAYSVMVTANDGGGSTVLLMQEQ